MEVQMAKWSTLSQAAADSVKKASTINKNLLMSLSQQQMDIMGIYMEGGVKQAQLLTKPCDAKSVLSTQADLVQEFTKKLLNNFRVSYEIAMDARTEFSSLYQSNAQAFAGRWLALGEQAAPAKAKITVTISEPAAPKRIAAAPAVAPVKEAEAAEIVEAVVEEVKPQVEKAVQTAQAVVAEAVEPVKEAVKAVETVVEEAKPQVAEAVQTTQEVVEEAAKPVKKVAASTRSRSKTVAEKATSIKTPTKTTANRGRNRKPPAPKV